MGTETEGFTPVAVTSLDLERPLAGLEMGTAPSGLPYGRVLTLVRLHGDPLGAVELPLRDGRLGPEEQAKQIWAAVRERLQEHGAAYGCLSPVQVSWASLLEGLGCGGCRARTLQVGDPPSVTVIVATAARPERLARCLSSLANLRYRAVEVLIVDNAPGDSRTRALVSHFGEHDARIRYTAEPNAGLSFARNRGIRESSSEILAFTDDDVEVDPDWVSWIARCFALDPQVGAVTGLVMPARLDTPEQEWFERFGGFSKGTTPRTFDLHSDAEARGFFFPYWGAAFGSGNNMAFRRQLLEQMDGFDVALGAGRPVGGEDLECFSRVILMGNRIAYEPRALCWHDHRATAAALRKQTFHYATTSTGALTKWVISDPRLLARLTLGLGAALFRNRQQTAATQRELSRLAQLFSAARSRGLLAHQLAGFLLGPPLYLYSRIRSRRRRT